MSNRRRLLLAATGLVLGLAVIPGIAIAGQQFSDVSDGNIFSDDIAWLAESGITLGCNPPANTEFCPGDTVRRETMAAFMHRLAVNRVVDAGTLQGLTAAELSGGASAGQTFASCSDRMALSHEVVTEIGAMAIVVPEAGRLSMTSQISLDVPLAADGSLVHLWQTIDATCESESGATAQGYSDLANSAADIVTFTTNLAVGSGDHVIRTCATAHELTVGDTTNVSDSHISVVWTPADLEVADTASSPSGQDVATLSAEVKERASAMRGALSTEP
jgi:hypothetical protein